MKKILLVLIGIVLMLVATYYGFYELNNKNVDAFFDKTIASFSDSMSLREESMAGKQQEADVEQEEKFFNVYDNLEYDTYILDPKYKVIKSTVQKEMNNHSVQGTILVGVDDDIVYAESFGKASKWDGINNTLMTRYGIASLTKSFTATSIMKLYEEGKLDINDTIDKYFPDYIYGKDITILQLMQMRSGIIDYLNDMENFISVSDCKKIYDSFVENNDYKGLDEYPWSRDDMLRNIYNDELKFTPDEKYSYSNTNYYMLGCIIEQVSGMKYDEYVAENIFKPCHMDNSSLKPLEGDAVSYMQSEGFVSSSYETLFSAGGIRSNVFDMFSWLRNLTKGNVVSSDTFYRMIDTTKIAQKEQERYEKEQEKLKQELGTEYEEPKVDPNKVPTYYACGLQVTGSKVWHAGYIDGFSNYMSTDLDTGITIIILTNSSDDRVTEDVPGLWKKIYNAANSVK